MTGRRHLSTVNAEVSAGDGLSDNAMGRIWRAAGFVAGRAEGAASDRYITRSSTAAPLRPRLTTTFSGRRPRVTRRGILLAVLLALGLVLGGLAIGRYVFPTGSIAAPTVATRAASVFAQSIAHQRAGQLTAAEQGYAKVIRIDPLYYSAYYDLGVLYQESNRPRDATLAYEKTLIINSTFQPALFNLAILDSTSDPQTAIALYKRIQQLHPQNPSAVAFNLGLVYRETGKVSAGNAQLRYAISLDPSLASKVPSQYKPIK
jgi:tetratricopeptide (TPR) repeat protein